MTVIEEVLAEVRPFQLSYPADAIMVASDLNTDFGRQTPMVRLVMDGFERVKLRTLWQYFPVDYTYKSTSSENVTCSVRPFDGIGGQCR